MSNVTTRCPRPAGVMQWGTATEGHLSRVIDDELVEPVARTLLGIINKEGFVGKTATLDRPGAADYMAQAMVRGTQCTGDFTTADHLALPRSHSKKCERIRHPGPRQLTPRA